MKVDSGSQYGDREQHLGMRRRDERCELAAVVAEYVADAVADTWQTLADLGVGSTPPEFSETRGFHGSKDL